MKNNKGFSLVELIIVIAIMAVLVGVLAPTYLQYVEKSKKSNDSQTVDSIINALEICAIDPEVQVAGEWALTITVTGTETTYVDSKGASDTALDTKMENAMAAIVPTTTKLKSTKWNSTNNGLQITAAPVADGYGKITISMNITSGTYKDANKAFKEFTNHAKVTFS